MAQPVIALVPVGELAPEVIPAIHAIVEARFRGRTARLSHQALSRSDFAYAPGRHQFEAAPILDRLASLPIEAERVIGVVDVDLFALDLDFIFGQAQLGGRFAVVSLARLRPEFWVQPPDQRVFLARVAKEAVHELGHTYGLSHCPLTTCVMHCSNIIEETDRKSDRFCLAHEAQLQAALVQCSLAHEA